MSLRNIKQRYLNEYKENSITAGVAIVGYIIYALITFFNANDSDWGRIVCSFLVCPLPPLSHNMPPRTNISFLFHACRLS